MKKLILLTLFFGSAITYSQTKKIFHKSHSGKSSTLFMDSKNNFGPGMAPVRYQTPVSPIKLNYALTKTKEYPLVRLDTLKKTMRFFDMKDSLLGCDRNYTEYISQGDIIFDVITNEFYVFQSHFRASSIDKWEKTNLFLPITDSIDSWENKNFIRARRHFIRDGNNHRILMSYPKLKNEITQKLKYFEPEIFQDAQKIIIDKDIQRRDDKLIKKEKKRVQKLEKKQVKIEEKEEENSVPISTYIAPQKPTFILRWVTLILFVFSLFIFVGVQRIVKDELAKNKH